MDAIKNEAEFPAGVGASEGGSGGDAVPLHLPAERSGASSGRVTMAERVLLRRGLTAVGDPPIRIVLWTGEEIATNPAAPVARIIVRDRATLLRLALNPDVRFGDAYTAGRIDVEGSMLALMEAVGRTTLAQPHSYAWPLLKRRLPYPRFLALAQARDNIHHHYDIGNDFYRLWLDEQMVYTCAYFPTPAATLEEAQIAKMDHVARKLQLRPGQTVIEAGCGWGSLARFMAARYGVKVRAFNISREQVKYARERAAAEGVGDRVEYVLDDYRNVTGACDAFVSVGMLEHVGPEHYRELGAVIGRCLAPQGRGLIHSIGRDRPMAINGWIARRIFPGGHPPSLREAMAIFEPWGLSVLDVENLRLHYARTLAHWLDRFERSRRRVAEMFDERFVRAWRLYLAGSQAAFSTGWMQLFQITFARNTDNTVPMTREHLYPARGE